MANGGLIGVINSSTTSTAGGRWKLSENFNSRRSGTWPRLWDNKANKFKTITRSPLDIFAWCGGATDNNCTVTRDTTVTDSPYGGVPLKMVVTGTDPHIMSYSTHTGGPWNLATAANGETWQLRVLAKGSVATTIELFIFGTDSAGNWSGLTGTVSQVSRSITTSWEEYTHTYTFANAGVQAIQVRLDGPGAGGTATVWFDGLQIYKIN